MSRLGLYTPPLSPMLELKKKCLRIDVFCRGRVGFSKRSILSSQTGRKKLLDKKATTSKIGNGVISDLLEK